MNISDEERESAIIECDEDSDPLEMPESEYIPSRTDVYKSRQ